MQACLWCHPITGNATNNRDRFGIRAELLYVPSDDLSVRITADFDEYDEICCAVGSTSYGTANVVTALFGGQIIPNNPYTEKAFFDFLPILINRFFIKFLPYHLCEQLQILKHIQEFFVFHLSDNL